MRKTLVNVDTHTNFFLHPHTFINYKFSIFNFGKIETKSNRKKSKKNPTNMHE